MIVVDVVVVLDAFIEACQGPVMVSVPNDSFLESPENPCLEAGWNFEASGGLSLRNHVAEVVEAFVPLTQTVERRRKEKP
ncbi:hypothetical protein V6N11_035518 [Hibiscus sabdariffa]|uniref:Uncharacterized protein n=1 Tax=Hibiscus sabdariffa TaxID=183260 RepID=A0ABR2R0N5_9ROSI